MEDGLLGLKVVLVVLVVPVLPKPFAVAGVAFLDKEAIGVWGLLALFAAAAAGATVAVVAVALAGPRGLATRALAWCK